MFREIHKVRQIRGEPRRRWFSDEEMDLIVWLDAHGAVTGFQLSYDKPRNEHAIAWKQDAGLRHYRVDDGEGRPGKHKATPLLVADGRFNSQRVAERFISRAGEMDAAIARFVYDALMQC